ncbi:MAG TPA: ABC transporter substrate-binding protein [Azospirillaceae bacterium]|nr:ABC transporter substrate-binding protein [Azospirillaceae bacterium]
MRGLGFAVWMALAPVLACGPALADSLRVGVHALANTLDPHFHNLAQNNELAHHVFEPLVARDAMLRPVARLAVDWRTEDPRSWVFRLRPGVRFHDGRTFSARDVLYSYCRVGRIEGSPTTFQENLAGVTAVEARDAMTVVVRTREPDPLIPHALSNIVVVPAPEGFDGRFDPKGCAGADWPGREAFDDGRLAVGTGPYRVAGYEPGRAARLSRYDGYWGRRPAWSDVEFRLILDGAARTRAMMMGELDLISNLDPATLDALTSRHGIEIVAGPSTAVSFLQMDWSSDRVPPGVTGTDGRNPFQDVRVRRAVSMAIGRAELVKRVHRGFGEATAQLLPAGLPGYDPTIAIPSYDRDGARALLAEAGYPNGFGVVMAGAEVNRRVMEVLAFFLGTVGIRAEVATYSSQEFYDRQAAREFGLIFGGRISITGELLNQVVPLLATPDPARGRGLSNPQAIAIPELDVLLDRAHATLDDNEREGLLREIARLVDREVAIVPLFLVQGRWAVRKGLALAPRLDRHTLAAEIVPAGPGN